MAPVRVRSQPPGSSRSYRMPRQVPRSTAGETLPQPPATAPASGDGPSASRERQGERSSQTRAREREARRALKTLTAALPQIPAPEREQVPTRRQLRQQQLQRENPGLAPDAPVDGPARTSAPAAGPAGGSAAPAADPVRSSAKPTAGRSRTAAQPADGRARTSAAPADAPYQPQRPPIEGGRRARRSGDTGRHPVQPQAEGQEPLLSAAGREAVDAGEMSVEQALAARDLLMGQAKNMVAMMESRQEQSPHDVDLELLAQQKALAERAAVLNRRAADKKRLSDENEQRRHSASDRPIADIASAPMEFVAVPGSDQHVLRPSSTSYVPVVTTPVVSPPAQTPPDPDASRPAGGARTSGAPQRRQRRRRLPPPPGLCRCRGSRRPHPGQPKQRVLHRGRRSWPRRKRWPGGAALPFTRSRPAVPTDWIHSTPGPRGWPGSSGSGLLSGPLWCLAALPSRRESP